MPFALPASSAPLAQLNLVLQFDKVNGEHSFADFNTTGNKGKISVVKILNTEKDPKSKEDDSKEKNQYDHSLNTLSTS